MNFQYLKWDKDLSRVMSQFSDLMDLFNYLLLQASGDVNQVREWLDYLKKRGFINNSFNVDKFWDELERRSIIEEDDNGHSLTQRGEQAIRKDSLKLIFRNLKSGNLGNHPTSQSGSGGERLPEPRPYRFGDSITNIDMFSAVGNAIKRSGLDEISLAEDDLEVFETENLSSCATVLLIDLSHSMILYGEDRITPAKQVALALSELIMTQYPKDSLNVGYFGDDAKTIEVKDIPYLRVGPFHTNTKAGLELAQNLLRNQKHPNKQIFMITDGKPSAIFENGHLYKNSVGLDPKIINQTLDEAAACKRSGIVITTFMVTQDPYLVNFVEELSQVNGGRAYFSSLDSLGEFIFEDYVRNKRRSVR